MDVTWERLILLNLSKKRPKTFARPKGCRPLVIEPVHRGSSSILLVTFLGHPVVSFICIICSRYYLYITFYVQYQFNLINCSLIFGKTCFIILRPSKWIDCTLKGGWREAMLTRRGGWEATEATARVRLRWGGLFSPYTPSQGSKTLVTGKFCN